MSFQNLFEFDQVADRLSAMQADAGNNQDVWLGGFRPEYPRCFFQEWIWYDGVPFYDGLNTQTFLWDFQDPNVTPYINDEPNNFIQSDGNNEQGEHHVLWRCKNDLYEYADGVGEAPLAFQMPGLYLVPPNYFEFQDCDATTIETLPPPLPQ